MGWDLVANIHGADGEPNADLQYITVHRQSDQSIGDDDEKVVNWLSGAEVVGPLDDWFDTDNPTYVTIGEDGLYLLDAHVQFQYNATGRRGLTIDVDGSNLTSARIAAVSADQGIEAQKVVALSAGAVVSLGVYQNSGGALDLNCSANSPYLTITRLQGVIGPTGPMPSSASATYTTASIADDAEETGTLTLAKGYRLRTISCDEPCRVRVYTTAAKRTADAARAVGTDPTGDHGLIFEFVATEDLLAADLSPLVDGFCASSSVPVAIQNLSGGADTIAVTFTYVQTEA